MNSKSNYLIKFITISKALADIWKLNGIAEDKVIHLHDGVIRRSWHRNGELIERHDLNAAGKATRRLFYRDGRLSRREYHNRDGYRVSTELFGAEGHIEESIQHGYRPRHWWYKKGAPVKYTRGADTYVKDGKRWKRAR